MSNAKVRHRRRRRAENAAPTPLTDAQKREHDRATTLLVTSLHTSEAAAMLEAVRAIAARRGDADTITFHPDGHLS